MTNTTKTRLIMVSGFTDEQKQQIETQFSDQLQDMRDWFGGWEDVKQMIRQLEENDNEEASLRYLNTY